MALLVVGGFGVAGAGLLAVTSYRKLKSALGSRGVEHILTKEERETLQSEHLTKIKECAGPSGMQSSMKSKMHFLKDAATKLVPLIVGSTHPFYPGEAAPNPSVWRLGTDATREKVDLLSLANAGRPLVLNFGSYT